MSVTFFRTEGKSEYKVDMYEEGDDLVFVEATRRIGGTQWIATNQIVRVNKAQLREELK